VSKETLRLVSVGLLCTICASSNRLPRVTTIDVPAASETDPTGINAAGDIVGYYSSTTTSGVHGFLLTHGAFTTIDFPAAFRTLPTGIHAAGDIVGFYSGSNNSGVHGFLLSHGAFTTINFAGVSSYTEALGINPVGDIVGIYGTGTGQISIDPGCPIRSKPSPRGSTLQAI